MADSQVNTGVCHESVSHTSSDPVLLPGADVVPDVTVPSADADNGAVVAAESSGVRLDAKSVLTSPFAADPAPGLTPAERAAQRKKADQAALEHLLYEARGLGPGKQRWKQRFSSLFSRFKTASFSKAFTLGGAILTGKTDFYIGTISSTNLCRDGNNALPGTLGCKNSVWNLGQETGGLCSSTSSLSL